jgi:hypothetical protein
MDSEKRKDVGSSEVWYNAGVRIHNWELQGQMSVDLLNYL